jgi:WD40 repeat protein
LVDLDASGAVLQSRQLPGRQWVVTGLSFTPDGRHIGVISYEPGAYLLDGATLEQYSFEASPKGVELFGGVSFSADGRRMAYGRKMPDGQELMLWEPQAKQPPRTVTKETEGAVISAVAFAPGGLQLVHGGTHGGPVKLHDLESGQSESYATGEHGNVTALGFAPDGRLLVATCSDGSILAWDVVPFAP